MSDNMDYQMDNNITIAKLLLGLANVGRPREEKFRGIECLGSTRVYG